MKIQLSAIAMACAFGLSQADDHIQLVKDIYAGATSSNPIGLTLFDGKVYFAATGENTGVELYVSDGETAGTMMLKDINPGSGSSNPTGFVEFKDKLYFRANDGTNGAELWVTDGTASGTRLFVDINDGSESSNPADFVVLGNNMVFEATTPAAGRELWVTDGTVSGTKLLDDIQAGSNGSSLSLRPEHVIGGDTLVFSADDGVNGQSLYSTDGTSSGTVFLKDISMGDTPPTVIVGRPRTDVVLEVFFAVADELWVTDGTTAGTNLLQEGVEVAGSSRISSYTLGGKTFFFGRNTGETADNLWETRGTPATTRILFTGLESPDTEVSRGAASTYGLGFGPVLNGKMSLITDNGSGINIWVTDGRDIEPLIESAFDWVLNVKLSMDESRALFLIKNGTALDLWSSDYTDLNTQRVATFPDGISASVGESAPLDDMHALFTAGTADQGVELWKYEYPELEEPAGTPTPAPTPRPTPAPRPTVENSGPSSSSSAAPLAAVGVAALAASVASMLLL